MHSCEYFCSRLGTPLPREHSPGCLSDLEITQLNAPSGALVNSTGSREVALGWPECLGGGVAPSEHAFSSETFPRSNPCAGPYFARKPIPPSALLVEVEVLVGIYLLYSPITTTISVIQTFPLHHYVHVHCALVRISSH